MVDNSDLKTIVSLNNSNINNFDEIKRSDTVSKVILEFYAILVRPINILMKYNEVLNYNYKFFEDSDIINSDIINSDIINADIINSDIINSDIINSDIINSDIINLDTEYSSDIDTEKIFLKSNLLDNDIDYLTSSAN